MSYITDRILGWRRATFHEITFARVLPLGHLPSRASRVVTLAANAARFLVCVVREHRYNVDLETLHPWMAIARGSLKPYRVIICARCHARTRTCTHCNEPYPNHVRSRCLYGPSRFKEVRW